jgi:hypothetical protein
MQVLGRAAPRSLAGAGRRPSADGSNKGSPLVARPQARQPRRAVVLTRSIGSSSSSSKEPASDRPKAQQQRPLRAAAAAAAAAASSAPPAASSSSAPSPAAVAAQRRALPAPKPFPSSPPTFSATCAGAPEPLGPTPTAAGVNFAVYAPRAARVDLILHGGRDGPRDGPASDVAIAMTRSGDAWHVHVDGLPRSGVRYGYRVAGAEGTGRESTGHRWRPDRVLLDPYAPLVAGRRAWAARDEAERFVEDVEFLFVWSSSSSLLLLVLFFFFPGF